MMNWEVKDIGIKDAKIITPFMAEDQRGYFLKSFEKDIFSQMGLNGAIQEDFESFSTQGVIRGLHFQTKNPQIKLVRAITGTIYDVIVDLRKNSPSFGKWIGVTLSGENFKSLWIPAGFAHGFQVLSENAIVNYKCIGKYEKGYDSGIKYDDRELNIDWKNGSIIVSDRDKSLQSFCEFRETLGGI